MNTYYFNDDNFKNTNLYINFINDNPKQGFLNIRASSASSAIPVEGLKVVVSKIVDNTNIIFFEGYTDSSGMIDMITLPAPNLNSDNMIKPQNILYDLYATYLPNNYSSKYNIRIYDGVCVLQNINITPQMKVSGINGS